MKPVLFVQIYEFHKVHRRTDSRPENQGSGGKFRNERPVRIEVAKDVPNKSNDYEQNGVAVESRSDSIGAKTQPPTLGNIRNLDRQAPDVPFDPCRDKGGRVFFQI